VSDFRSWRAADRVQALDSLMSNPVFLYYTATAERAFSEAAIGGLNAAAREEARLTCLAWRELVRMARDEHAAATAETQRG